MPHPFRSWPTWEEFLAELEPLGVECEEIKVKVNHETRTLLRLVNTRSRKRWPTIIDPCMVRAPLGPDDIRSICKRLRINVKNLEGFELG